MSRCLLALAAVIGVLGLTCPTASQAAGLRASGSLWAQYDPYGQQQQWQYQQQQQQQQHALLQQQQGLLLGQLGMLLAMIGLLITAFGCITRARKEQKEREKAEHRLREAHRGAAQERRPKSWGRGCQ